MHRSPMRSKFLFRQKLAVAFEIAALWYLAHLVLRQPFLPNPITVLTVCADMLANGLLSAHIAASLKRITLGIFFGIAFAVPAGLMLGFSSKADAYAGAVFDFLYIVPKVVFLPVIVVTMGIKDTPKIFLIALVMFFQQTIVVRDAVRKVPAEFLSYFKTLGASAPQIIRRLLLPFCIPDIMTALRSSLGACIALLFIAENFASSAGLGYFITKCMDQRNYEAMYAGITVLALIGNILYAAIGMAEKRLCRWKG